MGLKCECGNEARYIDALGYFVCAICPLKDGLDSIRLSDVPALLSWCRVLQRTVIQRINDDGHDTMEALASIIGREFKR